LEYVKWRQQSGAEAGGGLEHAGRAGVFRVEGSAWCRGRDTAGNVYVTDTGGNRVLELAAG